VVVGAGPGGLVTAMECAFMGARVTVIEKRDYLSRNNILHLWPFTMKYLASIGAKTFYPKFGTGGVDHIGTQQIQRLLIKINLLFGVKFYFGHNFDELYTTDGKTTLARCSPAIDSLPCTLLIGADGVASTVVQRYSFRRTTFTGSLCIGMTFNFKHNHTSEEVGIREFAYASLYNQAFFQDIQDKYNIGLENLVYYQGETHYFVMTLKKNSLFDRGVFKDSSLSQMSELLDPGNLKEEELLAVARDTATFVGIPETCEILLNHQGNPDIQLFDFSLRLQADESIKTIRYSSSGESNYTEEIESLADKEEEAKEENQSAPDTGESSEKKPLDEANKPLPIKVEDIKKEEIRPFPTKIEDTKKEENRPLPPLPPLPQDTQLPQDPQLPQDAQLDTSQVIVTLVGDALIEPFWPLGTGCNRAVLSGLDAAWIVHEVAAKKPITEIMKTRQRCYIKMKSALAESFVEPFKLGTDPFARYTIRSVF